MKIKQSAFRFSICLMTILVAGSFGVIHSEAARLKLTGDSVAAKSPASDLSIGKGLLTGMWGDDTSRNRFLLAESGNDGSDARERWKNMSPEQKKRYRQRLKRWQQLSPEQQDEIKGKYERYKNLTPEQRRKIRKNWDRYQQLSPEQQQRIKKKHRRWKNLSPEEKQRIKKRRRRYRNMTPEQRRQMQEKRKKWQNLPPEKRQQLREQYRKKNMQRQPRENDQSD